MAGGRPTRPSQPLPAGHGIARLTRSVWSGVLIGVGIAAFVDETVFHQLLHWHHFYDKSTPSVGLVSDGDEYNGELDVDFVADGTSRLTVRLHTTHSTDQAIDDQLRRALAAIKTTIERPPTTSSQTPHA